MFFVCDFLGFNPNANIHTNYRFPSLPAYYFLPFIPRELHNTNAPHVLHYPHLLYPINPIFPIKKRQQA